MIKEMLVMTAMALAISTNCATAEVAPPVAKDTRETAPVDCRAAPDPQPGAEQGAPLPDTSVLDECGSVLAPPVSADQEIVEQPTQGGETPVIDPELVPPPAEE